MKHGDIIELNVESIGFEGISIARKDGLVYFVDGALPGETVKAEVRRKRKNYVETKSKELISVSGVRVQPECKWFGICGGCSWQNMAYASQLDWKRKFVIDAFDRIGKVEHGEIHSTLECPEPFHYRNKMEFSFGASRWMTTYEIESGEDIVNRHFALGLHIPGRFDKVLDIDSCKIHPAGFDAILEAVRSKALELGCSAYNERTCSGFLRNLILRTNRSGDVMMILVTKIPVSEEESALIGWLKTEYADNPASPGTVIHAINDSNNPVKIDTMNIFKGSGHIEEKINDIKFRISPFSFFQTNSLQLERFINKIISTASLNPDSTVWDLYCGTGSITLPAARHARIAHGFELSQASIDDAITNAGLNGINNASFQAIDLHSRDGLAKLASAGTPDVVILDPPRAGMHKDLAAFLLELQAPEIIYVSCNPATQARDCAILTDNYIIESIQPVDMFPQTYHVESIARLVRR